ncbi:TPA: hypothetical protein ACL54T_002101, partial [Streptococcus pneumoniae]
TSLALLHNFLNLISKNHFLLIFIIYLHGMTDEVIIRISLAALLRWQPERSEVSLYIICIVAYKVSLYFIDGFNIALIMASHSKLLHK